MGIPIGERCSVESDDISVGDVTPNLMDFKPIAIALPRATALNSPSDTLRPCSQSACSPGGATRPD